MRHSCTWSHTGVLRAWPLPLACPRGSPLCCSPVLPGPQPSRPLCGPHADGHGEFSEIPSEGPAGAWGPGCWHPRCPLRAAPCGLGAGALRSLWATSSALSCDLRSVTSPASLLTWKMEFKTWLRRRLRAPLWEVSCRAPGLRPTFPARLSGSAVHTHRAGRGLGDGPGSAASELRAWIRREDELWGDASQRAVSHRLQTAVSVGVTPRSSFSVPGSLAVPNQRPFSQSHSAEGQGEGAGRAGVRAAEPQERQRRQPR